MLHAEPRAAAFHEDAQAVDDRQVGTGRPGPITKRIQETYFATVRGQVDQYKDWLDHVD